MNVLGFVTRSVARRVALSSAAVATLAASIVGCFVVLGVMKDAAAAERRDMLLVAVLGGAATVGSVAAATVVIVNRLLRGPLVELTAALHAAEKGKWLKLMQSHRDDELGELSRAFDRLSATVTDLKVAVIDSDRELSWTRRELKLKEALSLLFELTQTITAETNLEAILAAVPARIGQALGFEQIAVLLWDDTRSGFVVRGAFGIDAALGVTFPKDDPISGLVAKTGEALVIPDTTADARYSHFQGRHRIDGAFASVPMKVQGRIVGLFNVLRPGQGGISESDVRLLTSLASYAGLALAHAAMHERLLELSITDDLTGLLNRRALFDAAAREIERGRRAGRPLAALMIDLDHFKRINDALGHPAGDHVLRQVADALRGALRATDVLGRYGGEEFVVLLPEDTRAQALAVAEKLRAAVGALAIDPPLTISVGVALFPDDATDVSSLVAAADRALLEAKRGGRDRVVAA